MLHIGTTMKLCRLKISLIILFVFLSVLTFGQVTISGKVIDKQDGLGLPGVGIFELGFNNGTLTDTGGYFSFQINSDTSVIQTRYLGYKNQDIKVKDTRYFNIKLKTECNIDFFDYNDIGIGFSSGTLNSPIGGYGYLNFIFFKLFALHTAIDYQTDLSQNQKLDIDFGTLHLLADCGYNADIDLNYRSIDNSDFTFISYKVEGKINFSRPKILGQYSTLFFGYGLSDLSKPSTDYNNNSGMLFGFGTHIYRPLYLNINFKTMYWQDYWEYLGEIICRFKGFEVMVDYNVIDTYSEINLRFGYIINY